MRALKKCPTLTMKEMDEVIRKVNQNVASTVIKSRDSK
uniref:50S ribosomal protein L23 n=1 Tax=Elaeophora elaphi TaxID=1147741 RepID=A0A0R3RL97_9BILA